MGRLSGFAAWIVKGLFMALLMSLYWFYRTPQNMTEGFMAVAFCMVTSWVVVKILGLCFRSGGGANGP